MCLFDLVSLVTLYYLTHSASYIEKNLIMILKISEHVVHLFFLKEINRFCFVCSLYKMIRNNVIYEKQDYGIETDHEMITGIEYSEILFQGKSNFQEILIADTQAYGICLYLDGILQYTQKDQYAYQEMMSHVPMHCHENPKNILVIGGGDGGIVREILKHENVKIDWCEIDSLVLKLSQKYFLENEVSFKSEQVNLFVEDAFQFIKKKRGVYDVIIVDCSDPIGPNSVLFTSEFFKNIHLSLKDNGVFCMQNESIWNHIDFIKRIKTQHAEIFENKTTNYGYLCIPSYPSGQIGFLISKKGKWQNLKIPTRKCIIKDLDYYHSEIHIAAFVLPTKFAQQLNIL